MNQRRKKRPVLYSPLIPFFLAAVFGILVNSWFAPGVAFWFSLLIVSTGVLVLTKVLSYLFRNTRFGRRIRFALVAYLGVAEAWFVYALLSGSFWIWAATSALAGLRHEFYYNYFPDNEIGLHVPNEGVSSSVKLRVIKTPMLCKYDENNRSAYGDDCTTLLTAKVISAKDSGIWKEFSGKAAVSISGDVTNLRIGDIILVAGRLTRPDRQNNPNERDKCFYYRSQRILTIVRVNSKENVERISTGESTWRQRLLRTLERIRLNAASVVRERLSERNASVAAGMTLGFRNDVDDDTHEKFRRTGTVHLLAISGLHVMLVIGAIAFLLRMIGLSQECVCFITLFFVFIYLGLTDMRPPVIRATVLITIMCLGVLIRRQGFLLNSLACAALVLMAWNPCELFQPGAQLSFLATGTFLWSDSITIYEKALSNDQRRANIKKRQGRKKKTVPQHSKLERNILSLWRRISRFSWAKIRGVTLTGAIVWAVGTPLILSITNLFTPIAIIANPLIWLPATTSLLLSFLLEFIGLLSELNFFPGVFSFLLGILSYVTDKSFDLFLGILDLLSATKMGVYHLPPPPDWALWLFYCPLIFLTIFSHLRPKKRYIAIFALIWVCIVSGTWGVGAHFLRSREALMVDVFSVGHGCAVLGRFSDGRTFLYDCGSLENSQRAAEIVAKNLWNSGRTKIDIVVLSHADFDHYGGVETLVDLVKIKTVCVSPSMFKKENESLDSMRDALLEAKVDIVEISGGDSLENWGFPELVALHPTLDENLETSPESNENSVVLAIDYLDRVILLPGDLDTSDAVFLQTPPLKCDFVLAPHHGGHSENADDLYQWADPDYVGISGGSFLRSYATEDFLRENGRRVAHTFDDGDIQLVIERDSLNPEGRGRFKASTFKSGRSSERGTL